MAAVSLPAWAVVGADVVIEGNAWGSKANYIPAKISRVSKTSVWAKRDGRDFETRFVMGGWQGTDVLVQYGVGRGSWDRPQYLFAATDPVVIERQEANRLQDAYHKAQVACTMFAGREGDKPKNEQAAAAIIALRAYLAEHERKAAADGAEDQ